MERMPPSCPVEPQTSERMFPSTRGRASVRLRSRWTSERGVRPSGLVVLVGLLFTSVAASASTGPVFADVAAVRGRIAALAHAAEEAGASALLDQASRALLEADRQRARGDEAAARRAEAIAEAAVVAAERRIATHRARIERDAARAQVAELEARAQRAREALERARAELRRLGQPPPERAPSEFPLTAPVPEGE